jgi:hypothetical protein
MAKRQARTAVSKPVAAPTATLPDAPETEAPEVVPEDDPEDALLPEPQPEPPPVEIVALAPEPEPEPLPELDDFIAVHERASQDIGQVVTAISYPDATPRLHVGVYSGFPIAAGDLQATYSDGSTH